MTRSTLLSTFAAIAMSYSLFAQQKSTTYDLSTTKLTVSNRELTPFVENDKKGIRFSEHEGDGVAWLDGVSFSNGTVEIDIKGKDVLQQSFVGVAFHGVDEKTLDAVYFRPFNFRATDSVRH